MVGCGTLHAPIGGIPQDAYLMKGKWHRLHLMMMAWSKLLVENSAAATGSRKKVYTKDNMLSALSTILPLLIKSLCLAGKSNGIHI
eukprot:4981953-Ditylum_brightwellii.AAC.1